MHPHRLEARFAGAVEGPNSMQVDQVRVVAVIHRLCMVIDECMRAVRVRQTCDRARIRVASVEQFLARIASEGFEIIELFLGKVCVSALMQELQLRFIMRTHVDCFVPIAMPRHTGPYPEQYFLGHGRLRKMTNLEGAEQTRQ